MKHTIFSIPILCVTFFLQDAILTAQLDSTFIRNKNAISGVLLGDGVVASINYERIITDRQKYFIIGKLGIGYNEEFCIFDCQEDQPTFTPVVAQVLVNFGKRKNYFELGLGYTFFHSELQRSLFYPVIGYRLHPIEYGKVGFRAYCNPLVNRGYNRAIVSPVGIAIGITF